MSVAGTLRAALTMLPRPRGRALPGARLTGGFQVDFRALSGYQEVCGFGLSATLPVTYPHVLGFDLAMRLLTRRDFPFPVVGLVHVRNQITQLRELTAEDRLELGVQAVDLREHPRGRQFDVVTEASVGGELVWYETSTYLRKEKSSTVEGERTGAAQPTPHAVWRVPESIGAGYAAVSGDHNPIHTSRLGARVLGFPRPIAHGMWSLARCLSALEGRLPAALVVDASFKLPILLPAKVAFRADQRGFTLTDQRTGKPHLAGTLEEVAQ